MMKLFAHYDMSGTIHSITWANPPDDVSLTLTPRPGELVAEIEGQKLDSEPPSQEMLRDLARNHKITVPLPRTTLTRKR
jgi:hypothetical protein